MQLRTIDVVREIADVIPLEKGKTMSAEQLLERFLFPRSQQQVYASQLSGGERRRLYLCTILMKNPNFLILDEPTNDLDVMTLNILEDFLESYPGCLVVVTHDRFLLDRLSDHLFIFEGDGQIKDFNGTYSEYRAAKKLASQNPSKTATKTVAAAVGLTNSEKNEMKKLENEIAKFESRKVEIYEKLNQPNLNFAEMTKLTEEIGKIQRQLDDKEMRWLELGEKV
jgi:ABC transport system ATP-binding/permease protein